MKFKILNFEYLNLKYQCLIFNVSLCLSYLKIFISILWTNDGCKYLISFGSFKHDFKSFNKSTLSNSNFARSFLLLYACPINQIWKITNGYCCTCFSDWTFPLSIHYLRHMTRDNLLFSTNWSGSLFRTHRYNKYIEVIKIFKKHY